MVEGEEPVLTMRIDLMSAALACCLAFFYITNLRAQTADFAGIDFTKADSIAQLYPGHSLQDLNLLSDKLTRSLTTEEEKFRAIYKWVCLNIDNDYRLFKKNQHKRKKLRNDPDELRKWNQKVSGEVFRTLVSKHRTVCTGYAYLIKALADFAGLPCEVIHGYGRTAQSNIGGEGIANHSWNAIRLHNNWYLCDATWSSGAIDTEKGMFVRAYNNSYFLPDPALFIRNHYPADTAWTLLAVKPTLGEFLNRPLIYSSIFQYKIDQLYPETFTITASKGETVSFQFTKNSTDQIQKVQLIINGSGPYSVYPPFQQTEEGLHRIDHVFTSKGTYIVHILLDNKYAFTYTVVINSP